MSRHQFVDDTPPNWSACVAPHITDPERPRTATHGLLCAGHFAGLEQLLAELPALIGDVEGAIVRVGNGLSPKVSGTKEGQIPLILTAEMGPKGGEPAVWAALSAAHGLMASWCLLVLEEHPGGLHSPVRPLQGLGDDLRQISRFLLTHLAWCTEQPWTDDLLREMKEVRGTLHRSLSLARTRKVQLGPCEKPLACDTVTHAELVCVGILTATVHTYDETLPAAIVCPLCEERHEPETWRALAKRLRGGADLWLTSAQLSELLRVPLGTIWSWAHEDGWRRIDGRPKRYHADDAHQTYARLKEAS